jgi:ribonuclease HI
MAIISNENATMREVVPVSRGRNRRWDPPTEGVWKINIDGAFCEANKRGAWGFGVRDFEGKASMAGAGCIEAVADALCAEAHACVEALNAAADVRMQSIVLESDSQVLVKALQSKESDQALGGVLFREAKFLMSTLFNTPSVRHVSRSCNFAAHELAKFGRCRDPEHLIVWMDSFPEFLAEPEVPE